MVASDRGDTQRASVGENCPKHAEALPTDAPAQEYWRQAALRPARDRSLIGDRTPMTVNSPDSLPPFLGFVCFVACNCMDAAK